MRVCFVCLGNICRSPAAAAVFTQLATEAGVPVTVDSAGTIDYHLGERPHHNTLAEAAWRGIAIDHRSRQFTAADFDRFDLVVAMDSANRHDLLRLAPDDDARRKVVLLGSFPGPDACDVPDPFGLPPDAYTAMFDQLEPACRALLDHVTGTARST